MPEMSHNLELTGYQELEELAALQMNDLIAVLNDEVSFVKLDQESSFISRRIEYQNPDLYLYTRLMSRMLCDHAFTPDAELVSYRAFHFGYTVSGLLLAHAPAFAYGGELIRNTDADELRQTLITDTKGYMWDRPHLDMIIAEGLISIDPYSRHSEMAYVMAGSTLMFIDACEKAEAVDRTVADFGKQLRGWDGTI